MPRKTKEEGSITIAAVCGRACGCSYCRNCAGARRLLPSLSRFYLGKSTLEALTASPGARS